MGAANAAPFASRLSTADQLASGVWRWRATTDPVALPTGALRRLRCQKAAAARMSSTCAVRRSGIAACRPSARQRDTKTACGRHENASSGGFTKRRDGSRFGCSSCRFVCGGGRLLAQFSQSGAETRQFLIPCRCHSSCILSAFVNGRLRRFLPSLVTCSLYRDQKAFLYENYIFLCYYFASFRHSVPQ